jgi:predicted ribosome quality control (RQC) complex YloA/Tae2 family protein
MTVSVQPASRIPFDSLTLRAIVSELQSRLLGGQVQEIRQPAPMDVQLTLRNQSRNHLLLLSADARFARVHLTVEKRANAPVPPTFCMALRKRIENGYLQAIRQRGFDRILELDFARRNDAGELETYTLIAELMGKHSNLVLVDAEQRVVEAIKRISHRINRVRETLPGLPYLSPPEPAGRLDPFAAETPAQIMQLLATQEDATPAARAELLMQTCTGFSPLLAQEMAHRLTTTPVELLPMLWNAVFPAGPPEWEPVEIFDTQGALTGAYPIPLTFLPATRQADVSNLNLALDKVFRETLAQQGFTEAAADLRGRLERELKRLETHLHSVERALAEAERAETHKQTGELILANLWQIQPGMTSVTVQDYYLPDAPERTIELNPALSPQENAETWFRRFRKARDGAEAARTQRRDLLRIRDRLQEAQTQLRALTTETEVRNLKARLVATELLREDSTHANAGEGKSRTGPDFQGHKIKRQTTPEGYEIYIGDSATANDFLTTRLAAPNDIWVHVRASASAHVVIRTHGKPEEVPHSVLEYAAVLCARHSPQKHSALVAVDYTLKKYVRKPRGAAPGGADYTRETTLHVSP